MNNHYLKTAANAGLVLGVALVLVAHAGYLWGKLGTASWVGILNWLAIFAVQYYFVRHFREKFNGGFLTYGRGVSLGVSISVFSAVLYAVYFFVLLKTDPTYMENIMQMTADTLVRGGFSDAEVAKVMDNYEQVMTPWTVLFSSILSLGFIGLLFSLIVSAILRKSKPIFEE